MDGCVVIATDEMKQKYRQYGDMLTIQKIELSNGNVAVFTVQDEDTNLVVCSVVAYREQTDILRSFIEVFGNIP